MCKRAAERVDFGIAPSWDPVSSLFHGRSRVCRDAFGRGARHATPTRGRNVGEKDCWKSQCGARRVRFETFGNEASGRMLCACRRA